MLARKRKDQALGQVPAATSSRAGQLENVHGTEARTHIKNKTRQKTLMKASSVAYTGYEKQRYKQFYHRTITNIVVSSGFESRVSEYA
jgi:hypothetical protein